LCRVAIACLKSGSSSNMLPTRDSDGQTSIQCRKTSGMFVESSVGKLHELMEAAESCRLSGYWIVNQFSILEREPACRSTHKVFHKYQDYVGKSPSPAVFPYLLGVRSDVRIPVSLRIRTRFIPRHPLCKLFFSIGPASMPSLTSGELAYFRQVAIATRISCPPVELQFGEAPGSVGVFRE
jgi:hypothetical protein